MRSFDEGAHSPQDDRRFVISKERRGRQHEAGTEYKDDNTYSMRKRYD